MTSIEKEVRKLLQAKIIVPLRYYEWVANLVPIQKKNREIRLCVDFQNLNRASLKDNYSLPKMDNILQKKKASFTSSSGTFMYAYMPFGLINVGATFQRAMDTAFMGDQDKFVVVYLEDITVFSKIDEEHILHLKLIFKKCRRYGLSLSPNHSQFTLSEENLLGHIVVQEGVNIDPE
eukprot:PITA_03784